jgi:hypothetical protein
MLYYRSFNGQSDVHLYKERKDRRIGDDERAWKNEDRSPIEVCSDHRLTSRQIEYPNCLLGGRRHGPAA